MSLLRIQIHRFSYSLCYRYLNKLNQITKGNIRAKNVKLIYYWIANCEPSKSLHIFTYVYYKKKKRKNQSSYEQFVVILYER